MSLSFRNRCAVGLYPSHLVLTQTARGWRKQPGKPAVFSFEPFSGQPEWQAPLAALDQWLAQQKGSPADLELVVSDRFVRYACMPWSDDIAGNAETAALARIRFETLFGTVAAGWEIRVDYARHGKAGIGCAVDSALMTALAELCVRHGQRLVSVQPYFMRAFNWHRKRINGNSLLVVAGAGQCVLATTRNGDWHSIRSVRLAADAGAELPVLIERETVLQGLGEHIPVYVHAQDAADKARLKKNPHLTMLDAPAGTIAPGGRH